MNNYLIFLFVNLLAVSTACAQNGDKGYIEDPETSPQLLGGYDSLKLAIRNLTIPKENCGRGKVFVSFEIDTTGKVYNREVIKRLCPEADKIALEIVEQLRYKPATYKGKPVRVKRIEPIEFK